MNQNKCYYCEDGYIKNKNGMYVPCKHCLTPERFEKTLKTAIQNCDSDDSRKKALLSIKTNLPKYPVMALLEAETYGRFSKEFVAMLKEAYDIRPFMDVVYKKYED
jgi:hypothetical protein